MIAGRRFIADRARSMGWWTAGTSALILSTTALFPSIEGNESFRQLAEELPEPMVSLFGIDAAIGITTAPGYLHTRLFSTLLPALLLICGIGLGTRALAGAEEDGTLELTLAQPITRRRLALERFAATAFLLVALTLVATVVLVASAAPLGALEGVSLPGLVVACAACGSLALLHMSIAFAAGAAAGRRAVALGTAASIAVAGYVVHGLLGVTDAIDVLRFITPWHWYLERNMLAHGPSAVSVIGPLGVSALLVVAALWAFDRRDLR